MAVAPGVITEYAHRRPAFNKVISDLYHAASLFSFLQPIEKLRFLEPAVPKVCAEGTCTWVTASTSGKGLTAILHSA